MPDKVTTTHFVPARCIVPSPSWWGFGKTKRPETVVSGREVVQGKRRYAWPRNTFSAMLWLTGMYLANSIEKLPRPLVAERKSVA